MGILDNVLYLKEIDFIMFKIILYEGVKLAEPHCRIQIFDMT